MERKTIPARPGIPREYGAFRHNLAIADQHRLGPVAHVIDKALDTVETRLRQEQYDPYGEVRARMIRETESEQCKRTAKWIAIFGALFSFTLIGYIMVMAWVSGKL